MRDPPAYRLFVLVRPGLPHTLPFYDDDFTNIVCQEIYARWVLEEHS